MQSLISDPLWWHWMAFGLILIAAEIVVPSFVVIWFGIAAVAVSLMDWLLETPFLTELFVWIVLSVLLLVWWFRIYRPATHTRRGQADDDMGVMGIVTETIEAFERGRVKFELPVLGSSEWTATADETIPKGEKVVALKALGNMIKVKKAY